MDAGGKRILFQPTPHKGYRTGVAHWLFPPICFSESYHLAEFSELAARPHREKGNQESRKRNWRRAEMAERNSGCRLMGEKEVVRLVPDSFPLPRLPKRNERAEPQRRPFYLSGITAINPLSSGDYNSRWDEHYTSLWRR